MYYWTGVFSFQKSISRFINSSPPHKLQNFYNYTSFSKLFKQSSPVYSFHCKN